MNEHTEGAAGTSGSRARPGEPADRVEAPGNPAAHRLVIVSDVVCPWCYIGKRQLEQAFRSTGLEASFKVAWRPYELNPDMPPGGVDRREYRTRKFGSWENSLARDAQVATAGRRAGLEFRHDRMLRTPNTFQAHRLVWLAATAGVQDAVVEALFRAYFVDGRDVGDPVVLADIATSAGIDRTRAVAFLAGSEGADEVRREAQAALRSGISGVPTFILDGEALFSGAVGSDAIAAYLRDAVDTAVRRS